MPMVLTRFAPNTLSNKRLVAGVVSRISAVTCRHAHAVRRSCSPRKPVTSRPSPCCCSPTWSGPSTRSAGEVWTEPLLDFLREKDEWRHLDAYRLAVVLRPHGIGPKDIRRGKTVRKGYVRDAAFED